MSSLPGWTMNLPTPIGGGIRQIARPQGNTYQASADTSSAAIRTQTANRGHNVFRPDVYRVSEGYLN